MDDNNRASFTRWAGIARDQLGKTSDLVLGLGTGLLAFQASSLLNRKFSCDAAHWLALAAIVLSGASIAFAIGCALNRLQDFRKTASIAKGRTSLPSDELERLRSEVGSLGARTWVLFYWQIGLFAAGALAAATAVVVQSLW